MDVADRHLRAYAVAVQQINQLIPEVVVWELERDGFAPDHAAVEHCRDAINRAWRETAPAAAQGESARAA